MLSRRFLPPLATLVALLSLAGLTGACGGGKKKAAPVPPLEAYRQAEAFMAARKHGKAIKWFEKVDTSQDAELRAQVHLRLADAYFERSNILNLAEAQTRYQSFLNAFPLSDQAPYAQFRYAQCLARQINKPERDQTPTYRAMGEFRKVEELYPSSPWMAEARKSLADLEDHLSQDALVKAYFYYRRKAYRAAEARLRDLITANPDWEGRDEALFYLAVSLRRTERGAAGDEVLTVLSRDFPDTKFGKKAQALLARGGPPAAAPAAAAGTP